MDQTIALNLSMSMLGGGKSVWNRLKTRLTLQAKYVASEQKKRKEKKRASRENETRSEATSFMPHRYSSCAPCIIATLHPSTPRRSLSVPLSLLHLTLFANNRYMQVQRAMAFLTWLVVVPLTYFVGLDGQLWLSRFFFAGNALMAILSAFVVMVPTCTMVIDIIGSTLSMRESSMSKEDLADLDNAANKARLKMKQTHTRLIVIRREIRNNAFLNSM